MLQLGQSGGDLGHYFCGAFIRSPGRPEGHQAARSAELSVLLWGV